MGARSRPGGFVVEMVARMCQGSFSGEHEVVQLGGTSFWKVGTRLRSPGQTKDWLRKAEEEPRAGLPKPQCAYEAPGILTNVRALIQ